MSSFLLSLCKLFIQPFLKDKAVDILYVLIMYKSYEKTKRNKELNLVSGTICAAKAWYVLFLCAIKLHCCPKNDQKHLSRLIRCLFIAMNMGTFSPGNLSKQPNNCPHILIQILLSPHWCMEVCSITFFN